ncbi:hypothetical protein [Evansella clarkii]|jgi:hypothetical protein|uniref:hypothetical protein n=1 Tax=Evansella clarkii TaxID=79879 RepID=UPI0014300FCA|nr:hypothetical protein [Evansella clarkii]
MKDYHFCATCINFETYKADGKTRYRCKRLGYETKPDYKFNCWEPKENVQKLLEKDREK